MYRPFAGDQRDCEQDGHVSLRHYAHGRSGECVHRDAQAATKEEDR